MLPDNYTLYFVPEPVSKKKCQKPFSCDPWEEQSSCNASKDDLQLSCSASKDDLPLDCLYIVIIGSVNGAGKTNFTGNISLSKLFDT